MFCAFRVKKQKTQGTTQHDGQSSVDPEIYFKTMAIIQSLKPCTKGSVGAQRQQPFPASSPAVTLQRGIDGEIIENEADRLPLIQTTVAEGSRGRVICRWQKAVAATMVATVRVQSDAVSAGLAAGTTATGL